MKNFVYLFLLTFMLTSFCACNKKQDDESKSTIDSFIDDANDNVVGFDFNNNYDDSTYSGFVFGQEDYGDDMIVTGYTGEEVDTLVFPSELFGKAVVGIANDTFKDCATIHNVVFESPYSFGYDCFVGSSIESVDIHTTYGEESEVFRGFAPYCFSECKQLKSFYCSSYMTDPEAFMFYKDTALETVNLDYSFSSIYDGLFSGCTSLKEIWLPGTIEFIAEDAFEGVPKTCIIHGYNDTWLETWVKEKGYRWSGVDIYEK